MLRDEKILITGPASQVALPVVRALAPHNEVVGLARFSRPEDRARVEALGAKCVAVDLADGTFEGVPDDFTLVLHFAVVKSGEFDYDLAANAEGTGRLMSHCRNARAFLHCSSGGVYAHQGPDHPAKETDPLGDNHAGMMPTYSICKIAGETVARFAAREWSLPTVIARLSVPYGDNGGWPFFHLMMMKNGHPIPLHPDRPNVFNPLHEDDYVRMLPRLLEAASVPASVVNWGGDEQVSVEQWCAWLGELTGLEPKFVESEATVGALPLDLTKMHELVGGTEVPWKDGIRRLVASLAPELLR
jgi:nucleoside-diphosphate-sugar epimerase